MADVKKGSDLITTMGDTENRMKKIERQLAVPRRAVSSVVTEETTVSLTATPLTSTDSVDVVVTAQCLIHVYCQMEMKHSSGSFQARAYLAFDGVSSAGNEILRTSSSSYVLAKSSPRTVVSAGGTAGENGGPITFVNTAIYAGGQLPASLAAGKHTISLVFLSGGAGTASFKNRILTAWVQPF